MTFPALDAFAADRGVRRLTFRIYMYLQRDVLDLTEPRVVRVRNTAQYLRIGKSGVTRSLNWLVERGYLIEHPRESRGERVFTLAWTRGARNRSTTVPGTGTV